MSKKIWNLKISKCMKKSENQKNLEICWKKSEKSRKCLKQIWKSEKFQKFWKQKSENLDFFWNNSENWKSIFSPHRQKYYFRDFEKKIFRGLIHVHVTLLWISNLGFASRFSDFLQIFRFPNLFSWFLTEFSIFLYDFLQNIRLWSAQLSLFLDFQTDFWLLRNSTFSIKKMWHMN